MTHKRDWTINYVDSTIKERQLAKQVVTEIISDVKTYTYEVEGSFYSEEYLRIGVPLRIDFNLDNGKLCDGTVIITKKESVSSESIKYYFQGGAIDCD